MGTISMKFDETKCWQAVESRDGSFDGVFFYGVQSTKIFCRPSCPSRRPKREQVIFFSLPEIAKQSGFRSCMRCKPDQAALKNQQSEIAQRVCRLIEADPEDASTLEELAERVNLSPSYLQRMFKSVMGITPKQYAEAIRARRFKQSVKSGASVTEAIYDAGYGSSSRLYEKSARQLGMTPATYRREGRGMKINFTTATCPLGRLLIAATDRGICSVALGDNDEALIGELEKEFSQAVIQKDKAGLDGWIDQLINHLNGRLPRLDLPLDVRATAFQKLVWEELQRIPYGATASYGEIARRIEKPSATRAVARACATNPVALITPCHRVIREDGELSGYRWGIERKKALLEIEKQIADKK